MKGRKNNNILSCKAFMENVEFPVLRKSRPIVSNRTKKKNKKTSKKQGRGSQGSYHVLDVWMF